MKSKQTFMIPALVLIVAIVVLASCEDETAPYYTFFPMEIDSLSAPAEIMQTDTLRITFYSVPMSCCRSFYRFEYPPTIFLENYLYLQIIGKQLHGIPCECAPPGRVNEIGYEVTQMLTGYFYIEVLQPDGSSLIDSVLVYR